VYDELGKQASNGSLMLYDDTPGRILENQAQGDHRHPVYRLFHTPKRGLFSFFNRATNTILDDIKVCLDGALIQPNP
jgi:hypothetical protein